MTAKRQDVVDWMEATGSPAAEAVDHHWPGLPEQERRRKVDTVRQWLKRAREKTQAAVGTEGDGVPAPSGKRRPAPDTVRVALDRIPFLEWHLSEALADLQLARDLNLLGRVNVIVGQVSNIRDNLDDARGAAGRTVKIDENPAAVADAIVERQKRIDALQRSLLEARQRSL